MVAAARVTLANAPLVVKKAETIPLKLGGNVIGAKDRIMIDVTKQTLSDIQYVLKAIAVSETEAQMRLKPPNEPTILVVDSRENKPFQAAERKIQVTFGEQLDYHMIQAVERSLMSSIKANAAIRTDTAYASMAYWEWLYAPSKDEPAAPINVRNLTALARGGMLILKPRSPSVGLADMFAARKDAGWPSREWNHYAHEAAVRNAGREWAGPVRRSGGRGFMAKATDSIKRSQLLKSYTIKVVFTQRFKLGNELYSHGTPVIVIRGRRNKGYRRITPVHWSAK